MNLGSKLANELELSEDEIELVRISALLHDVGHGPFSHVSEGVLSFPHEELTKYVISKTSMRDYLEEKFDIKEINKIISNIHKKLTGNREDIKIVYEPSNGALSFEQALLKNKEKDLRIKSTSVGPHRDDIAFLVSDIDIRKYGSQGQQRTAALSLKLSEIELVKQSIHDTPVLLLDDVLSELDKHRQNYLLDSIHDIQTLITCTGVDEFVNHRFSINKVFHVQNGQVTKEN